MRWGLVLLLAGAVFINYVDRGAVPTAAHLMQDELSLTASQLGLLFSAFFWSYALLQIPAGYLAERLGALPVLAAGLVVWASATVLVGLAHSFAVLFALRLLLGVGESVSFPCVSKLLAAEIPLASLGRANGVIAFGYLFGPAVGTYFGGQILISHGWRAMFFVFGALSLLWLVPWTGVRSRSPMAARDIRSSPAFVALLRQRSLWGASLAHFSANYTYYFILTWLPLYLVKQRGFSTESMAAITGSAYLVNAFSALIGGWVLDRAGKRSGRTSAVYKSLAATSHFGSVLCMLCMAAASPAAALAAIFAYQVLCGASSPCTFAASQILAGPRACGRWVGIQNAVANTSGALMALATGFLIPDTGHFAGAFVLAATVSLMGCVAWLWIIPKVAPISWPEAPSSVSLVQRAA
ncbi:MAG: MFS transporter [Proteobacteria bacterium]|nr:MFS transporter [Pseudomonadota bacterium]